MRGCFLGHRRGHTRTMRGHPVQLSVCCVREFGCVFPSQRPCAAGPPAVGCRQPDAWGGLERRLPHHQQGAAAPSPLRLCSARRALLCSAHMSSADSQTRRVTT